jgi:hypothetical protein
VAPFLHPTLILAAQTFWLLPQLVERAEMVIAGVEPSHSWGHLLFIFLELLKVSLLMVLSVKTAKYQYTH